MQSSRGGASYGNSLSEAQQLRLFGLMRHVKTETAKADSAVEAGGNGSTPASGSVASKEPAMTADQQSAFEACRGLSCEEAKREVLDVVFSAAPYWKYEQFL